MVKQWFDYIQKKSLDKFQWNQPSCALSAHDACGRAGCLYERWWPCRRLHLSQGWQVRAAAEKQIQLKQAKLVRHWVIVALACIQTGPRSGYMLSSPFTCFVKTILPSRKGGTRLWTSRWTFAALSSSKSSSTSSLCTTPLVNIRLVSHRSLSWGAQRVTDILTLTDTVHTRCMSVDADTSLMRQI